MLSDSMPSAALLFLPRSSPTTVAGDPASAAGERAVQKSASAMRRSLRRRLIEVSISVFISVICFFGWLLVVGLLFAICSRKFGTKFPTKLRRTEFLITDDPAFG